MRSTHEVCTCISVVTGFALALAAQADTTITGRVTHQGRPVPDAIVRLDLPCTDMDLPMAQWRHHAGIIRTDADGRFFFIEAETPRCVRIVAAAQGLWYPNRDGITKTFDDIEVKLERIDAAIPDTAIIIKARLLDDAGKPVPGTALRLREVKTHLGNANTQRLTSTYGATNGTPAFVITDSAGEFETFVCEMETRAPVTTTEGRATTSTFTVEGGPFHGRPFSFVKSTERIDCRLTPGGKVSGRVERKGKPAADVPVALIPADTGWLMGEVPWTVRTDGAGKFTVDNVWPNTPFVLYVPVGSQGGAGGSSVVKIEPVGAGEVRDAGVLAMATPRVVSGKVRTESGIALPPTTGVTVLLVESNESFTVPVTADGKFTISGLPDGAQIRLCWSVPHALRNAHTISSRSPSRSRYSDSLEGIVDRDINDLELLYEKTQSSTGIGGSLYDRPFRSIKDPIPGEG